MRDFNCVVVGKVKELVYVGCLNHDGMIGITLGKLQRGAGRTFRIVTISLLAVK